MSDQQRNGDAPAYTVKELVLRIDTKLDDFIAAHAKAHTDITIEMIRVHTDPAASAVGQVVASNESRIESLEKSNKMLMGGLALASVLGLGSLAAQALGLR